MLPRSIKKHKHTAIQKNTEIEKKIMEKREKKFIYFCVLIKCYV